MIKQLSYVYGYVYLFGCKITKDPYILEEAHALRCWQLCGMVITSPVASTNDKVIFYLSSDVIFTALNIEYLIYGPDLWGSSSIFLSQNWFQRSHYEASCRWNGKMTRLRLLIARILMIYQHFVVQIVLSVLNNGSPKLSLGSFFSNLGYALLTNKLIYTLKDMIKSIIILFNQINFDKVNQWHSEVLCYLKPFWKLSAILNTEHTTILPPKLFFIYGVWTCI